MKRKSGLLIAAVCILCMAMSLCVPVSAKTGKGKEKKDKKQQTSVLKISKITCTSAGKVNVSFKKAVEWDREAAATVKDAEGKELKARLIKKNRKLAAVAVEGMVKGQKYSLEITGVKAAGAEEFSSVAGKFTAKKLKTGIKTKKLTVSRNIIIVKFKGKAAYKDLSVSVTDPENLENEAEIVKKTKSQIKIRVNGLQKGKRYTITVNGVKLKKEKNFGSVVRTVTAK